MAGLDESAVQSRGAGGYGISSDAFGQRAAQEIARLADDLMQGTYEPDPLRHFQIDKPDGGRRDLAVRCIADRVVQSGAASILTPVLEAEFEEGSCGYRPGRSLRQAVDRVMALRRQGFA